MGHVRLGTLPRTRRWEQVVALLGGGGAATDVAAAAMEATQDDLARYTNDPALQHAFWLLMRVPLAARTDDFGAALRELGVHIEGAAPTPAELASAFTQAIDRAVDQDGLRSELGEIAEMAAVEVLVDAATDKTPGLFGTPPDAVRRCLAAKATEAQFAGVARDFFARFMEKFLGYYVGRELPLHVGRDAAYQGLDGQREFVDALALHCRQASLIVERFAGAWYSKAQYEGDLSRERTGRFIAYALKKIRDELMLGAQP